MRYPSAKPTATQAFEADLCDKPLRQALGTHPRPDLPALSPFSNCPRFGLCYATRLALAPQPRNPRQTMTKFMVTSHMKPPRTTISKTIARAVLTDLLGTSKAFSILSRSSRRSVRAGTGEVPKRMQRRMQPRLLSA